MNIIRTIGITLRGKMFDEKNNIGMQILSLVVRRFHLPTRELRS
jgi:hypothetical protein